MAVAAFRAGIMACHRSDKDTSKMSMLQAWLEDEVPGRNGENGPVIHFLPKVRLQVVILAKGSSCDCRNCGISSWML
jgi:hypothetical protein